VLLGRVAHHGSTTTCVCGQHLTDCRRVRRGRVQRDHLDGVAEGVTDWFEPVDNPGSGTAADLPQHSPVLRLRSTNPSPIG
jgi:hypothetical protein